MHTDNTDPTCDTLEPLLAGYALGEQNPDARQMIDMHLQSCATCRQTLHAYGQVADLLPLSVPDAAPALDLRERVIAAVDAAASGRARPTPQLASQPDRGIWIARFAWLLGALALLLMFGWNISLQQRLAAEQANRMAQEAALAALLQSSEVARRPLESDVGATGELLVAADGQTAALVVSGMPQLAEGRVYQLWLVADEQRISGGTFTVDSSGRGALLVQPPQPWSSYERVGVTEEPAGGSPGPTSPRVIGGTLS